MCAAIISITITTTIIITITITIIIITTKFYSTQSQLQRIPCQIWSRSRSDGMCIRMDSKNLRTLVYVSLGCWLWSTHYMPLTPHDRFSRQI